MAGKVSPRRRGGRWHEPKESSSEFEVDDLASGRASRNASAAPSVCPASARDGSLIFLGAFSAIVSCESGGRASA